ncbi:MAG: CehA/McbA family metallohydrolase, partial [Chloroflexota bacterium]
AGTPVAVWLQGSGDNGTRQVVASWRAGGGWEPPKSVGTRWRHAIALHAAADGERVQAVWCDASAPAYTIWTAAVDGRAWREPVQVTPPHDPTRGWVHRPEVALAPGGCWTAWDVYDGATYSVWAAFVANSGVAGLPERVSLAPEAAELITPEAWQFVPSVCVDTDGTPWVAWLCSQDVTNEAGIVDQWPVARVARRTPAGWRLVRDAAGSADLGRLAWGLLPYGGHGVWGYLGRRRKPLMVADPVRGAWLLWERKEEHDGRTPVARGVLCARHLAPVESEDGTTVGPILTVATGPRYYVPGAITLEGGRRHLWLVSRASPEGSYRDVALLGCPLDVARPLAAAEQWDGWQPIRIAERRPAPRPAVRQDGQTYRLYWADLHVHTALSADAEGHPDELIAYARDKARLDCLALSDNDRSHLSLTASDWETSRHYARHFDEAGRFVLLPAYEWTYRPEERGPPNHRTVIGVDERRLPLLRHQDLPPEPDRIQQLAAFATEHDLVLHVHHERWALAEPPVEANWEVCSGWGSHLADPQRRGVYHTALAAGHRLGFVGNSDGHRRNPGLGGALTGVWAAALTREAVIEALRRRRCFATDGSRIVLHFWVGDTFMGGETTTTAAPVIRWEVAVTRPPATVALVRDGEPVRTWRVDGETLAVEHVDEACPPGVHTYYLSVEQSGRWREWPSNVAVARGPHAWSSPVWVTRR